MSEALAPDAPGSDSAASSVEDNAPGDGTAVADGSAGATTEMVEASRFNGLMSAHQKALSDLEAARTAQAALEARLTQQETTQVTEANDSALAAEVAQLRRELQAERLESVKARVLEQYPEAKPLADLIVGDTPEQIESVAAQIAQRLQAAAGTTSAVDEAAVAAAAAQATEAEEAAAVAAAANTAPVVVGGTTPPASAGQEERVAAALAKGSWAEFWAARTESDVSTLA